MLILKILLPIVGVAFLLFGYLIFFRKKYSLINGFDAAFKEGRKTEAYARRVGAVELILGILLLIASVILILLA